MWVTDNISDHFKNQYTILRKITEYKSQNFNIEVFNTNYFGQLAIINQKDLMLQSLNYIESEILSHVPACVYGDNNGENGSNLPKKALILGTLNIEIASEFKKHNIKSDIVVKDIDGINVLSGFFSNFKNIMEDKDISISSTFVALNNRGYDIIVHCGDILKHELDALIKLANKHYILIFPLANPFLNPIDFKENLELASSYSKILMPFKIEYGTQCKYFCFLSNKFHPLADLRLHVSDFLETRFYNSKLHESMFALSNNVKLLCREFVKN